MIKYSRLCCCVVKANKQSVGIELNGKRSVVKMRTYARKKPEYQVLENVLEICRLCLMKTDRNVPIFDSETTDIYSSLSTRIMLCVGLEVTRSDDLPAAICLKCYEQVEKCYAFRKMCENAYQKLKLHLQAVKRNEATNIKVEPSSNKLENETNNDGNIQMNFQPSEEVEQFSQKGELGESNLSEEVTSQPEQYTELSRNLLTDLLKVNLVSKEGNRLVLHNNTTFELATQNGSVITFALEEEDEKHDILINNVANINFLPAEGESVPSALSCPWCSKRFSSRALLRRHARVHSALRPHRCAHCRSDFKHKDALKRHELLHDESRPFPCLSCSRSFTSRQALRAHSRSHAPHAATLHACPVCEKLFMHASGVSRHMWVHAGGSPCASCGRLFRDGSSLARHVRTQHGGQQHSPPGL